MPDWLVDHSTPDADPWPPSVRARAQDAVERADLGVEAVRVLLMSTLRRGTCSSASARSR